MKTKHIIALGVAIWCVILAGSVEAVVIGDINLDGQVDLSEAIHALQVTAGLRPDSNDRFAPVQRTGQTACYSSADQPVACDLQENDLPGQDGQSRQGVSWPDPRFTDNGDGTVTDNLTGLMWLKNASFSTSTLTEWTPKSGNGRLTWYESLTYIEKLNNGDFDEIEAGNCGYEDWRLPNIREIASLIHYGYSMPALSNTTGTEQWSEEAPFVGVQSYLYWSSTTVHRQALGSNANAWVVDFSDGDVKFQEKNDFFTYSYVWPVR